MNNVEKYLERPVSFTTAAKKIAAIRGHAGRDGGWIYTDYDMPICQGWHNYAERCARAGLISGNGDGKWFVQVTAMRERDYRPRMRVFADKR